MTLFASTLTTVGGHRAVELTFAVNEEDRRPRRVLLIVEQELAGQARLPFAYQFFDDRPPAGGPHLIVLAGPGVAVVLEGFPEAYIPQSGLPRVDLFRVQDPATIPPLGDDLGSLAVTGSYVVSAPFALPAPYGATPSRFEFPVNYFKVDRVADGVVIQHPASTQVWTVRVPSLSTARGGAHRDASARFAYWFDPEGIPGGADHPLLRIVKTPGVRITVAEAFLDMTMFGLPNRLPTGRAEFEFPYWAAQVFEVDGLDAVPRQGEELVPGDGWRFANKDVERIPPVDETIGQALLDVTLGFLPGAGDVLDVAELVYGIFTGHDRWGRRLSPGDLWIMGAAALLPILSGPVLRRGAQLVRTFGDRAPVAGAALEDLGKAGLSQQEAEAIRRAADTIRRGDRLSDELVAQVQALASRLERAPPTLDSLLNQDASGFIVADLQEAYRDYYARRARAGATPLPPRDWALAQATGRPRRILESLLGTDYVRVARGTHVPDRYVNVRNIPRPAGYTDELLLEHRRLLADNWQRLVERLGPLLEAARSQDPLVRLSAVERIRSGLFSILKGNVAEILAARTQLEVLGSVLASRPEARGSRIFSGIRMRLREDGKLSTRRLFSDNIIAVERGGNLYVYAVFEVKSGQKGGQEATEQIFDWIEKRLEDGVQLVVPAGARTIDASGKVTTVAAERVFTYRPGSREPGQIIFLAAADRHLIVAQGASHLGLDSAMRIAAPVDRHELPLTSAQIDYLGGQVLQDIAASAQTLPAP
jgi:hypothetical protein